MRLKVFGIVLKSFILVFCVNAIGSWFGENLKQRASTEMAELALGEKFEEIISKSEIMDLISTPEYLQRFKDANEQVTEKYGWYNTASLGVQGVLILLIAWFCSYCVINVVKNSCQL